MARQLVIAVVLAVAGSSLGACSTEDEDDDSYWCRSGAIPPGKYTYVSFSGKDLSCARHDDLVTCPGGGDCCQMPVINSTTQPVACDGPCVTLDETSCASAWQCYVARDVAAFYRGAPDSFLGCFPRTPSWTSHACEFRSADTCPSDGTCAGLYEQSSSATFVGCVDETLIAGSCTEVATCMKPPPSCPADRTPGVAAGCYTGACIPNDLCAP